MREIVDKIDGNFRIWINIVATAVILLMFAFAFGMMIAGGVLDRVDLIAVGFASLCVPTLILLGLCRK